MFHWILYLFALPCDLLAWAVLLIARVVLGQSMSWTSGCLVVYTKSGSWLARFLVKFMKGAKVWGGSTIGHAIIVNGGLQKGQIDAVLKHELIHVEQFESHCVLGFTIALSLVAWYSWALAFFVVWPLFPVLGYLAAMLTAVLRNENAYRGNYLEEAAYDGARVRR